ncbi:MAG: hypothetical protein ACE5KE_00340 [Methanosarcinales archaeon]
MGKREENKGGSLVPVVSIRDILTKEQINELEKFLKKKKSTPPLELTQDFKKLFRKWEKELKEKGVLPDYLAYVIAWYVDKVGYDRALLELKLAKKKLKEVI